MKHLLFLAALVPSLAFGAAQTYVPLDATLGAAGRSVVATCAAGTTCDVPSAATDGASLVGVASVAVQVCAASGQTITSGPSFDVYFYGNGLWGYWRSYALQVPSAGAQRCGWIQDDSPGFGIPILQPRGRITVVARSAMVSSGALTITIYALGRSGAVL